MERPDATARSRQRPVIQDTLTTGDSGDLRAEWQASQTELAESVQILEALFQKFDVDPGFASELGAALTELGEELLAATPDDDAAVPGSVAPVVIERDATQPRGGCGGHKARRKQRSRDLN